MELYILLPTYAPPTPAAATPARGARAVAALPAANTKEPSAPTMPVIHPTTLMATNPPITVATTVKPSDKSMPLFVTFLTTSENESHFSDINVIVFWVLL